MSEYQRLAANMFIEALETRPDDFCPDLFTLCDTKTEIVYWVSSGFPFYGVWNPVEFGFGFFHGFRAWRAVKKFTRKRRAEFTKQALGLSNDL